MHSVNLVAILRSLEIELQLVPLETVSPNFLFFSLRTKLLFYLFIFFFNSIDFGIDVLLKYNSCWNILNKIK